jgi:hypothetical protein
MKIIRINRADTVAVALEPLVKGRCLTPNRAELEAVSDTKRVG